MKGQKIRPLFGTALILAGGKSSRMGFDKQYLKLGRKPLMDTMIHALSATFSDIIVVTNDPHSYAHLPIRLARDRYPNVGPLAGLEVGLAMSQSEYVFLRACDMPIYNDAYVRYMMNVLADSREDVATTIVKGYFEPFNSFYHRSLWEKAVGLFQGKKRSFRALIDGQSVLEIPEETARFFDPELAHYINLNTKEDIHSYRELFYI